MNNLDPSKINSKIILWSIAADPLILGGLGYFLRRLASLPPAGTVKSEEVMLLVFAAISLSLVWAGFQFAAGKLTQPNRPLEPDKVRIPFGRQIVAVALASSPGIFGFAHYLVYGLDWVLPVFNLGGFLLAAKLVLNFSAGRP
jgi:hypothetical protein